MTRLSIRDGLLRHVLTVDPQWDGSVMLHAETAPLEESGHSEAICIKPGLLPALIRELVKVRDARPSERVAKVVPARPAEQRGIV